MISGTVFVGKSGSYTAFLFCQYYPDFSVVETRVEIQRPFEKGEVVADQLLKTFSGRVDPEMAVGAIEVMQQPWFFERVGNRRHYRSCLSRLEKVVLESSHVNEVA